MLAREIDIIVTLYFFIIEIGFIYVYILILEILLNKKTIYRFFYKPVHAMES